MAQYQVPQFIDVEDKIFGPLTVRQFFYLIGGAVIIFIMYVFLHLWLVILLGAPIAGFSLALAFLKIDGVPFIKVVMNAISFTTARRLFLWKPTQGRPVITQPQAEVTPPKDTPRTGSASTKLTESKLRDLAWSLDVQKITKR